MKKYNYQDFKADPRTLGKNNHYPRYISALFNFIDNKKKDTSDNLFLEIDRLYLTGKHRSPSYVKRRKLQAIKLLSEMDFR